ncbi:MAG: hypothetical protein COV47_00670 [Candidatus Diapherotrites archaeon CG11_big_fil_rev_8_21_14_0_20_37_9]|nr:MAG: hypothetical protein COV47_00670 [Candidatus Diapherotrites archaeon CG11_big_fil_rev_8_21_14_0_20_37_9]
MGLLDTFLGKKKTTQELLDEKRAEETQKELASSSEYAVVEIQDVYSIRGVGVIPVGKVIEGVLVPGFKAKVGLKFATVKTIEAHHEQLRAAGPGESIGFAVDGVDKSDLKAGMKIRFEKVGNI